MTDRGLREAQEAPTKSSILPCPCGGRATLVCDDFINGRVIDDPDYYVECNGNVDQWCGASTPPTKQPGEAIARWNRMASEPGPA